MTERNFALLWIGQRQAEIEELRRYRTLVRATLVAPHLDPKTIPSEEEILHLPGEHKHRYIDIPDSKIEFWIESFKSLANEQQ